MITCEECRGNYEELKTCRYCQKKMCLDCYEKHMSWELRHKGLAERVSELWKKKKSSSRYGGR